eukprot:Protomagalhaensia_sp_Gyna_25__6091@NODE_97_length_5296_cov_22_579037_g74_i0_p2_GENE_NODE_97_length_5296_cov_22_579037_g74_i0NODE_97_length_5296_cov_22_579037_g74_i0_p2_ORF_typecomplete_len535_score85_45_NODE_97_length_5296_cov_22_579037_g74_i034065010
MSSFLHQVLTAHELDELGLNDAVRLADLGAPKILKVKDFFGLRFLLLSLVFIDAIGFPVLVFNHVSQWRSAPWLGDKLRLSGEGATLLVGAVYSLCFVGAEAIGAVPLRRQPVVVHDERRGERSGLEPWDLASAIVTFTAKLQLLLDLAFCLDCLRGARWILGSSSCIALVLFSLIPRLLLSLQLIRLLFQPTPHRFSLIDAMGAMFGFRSGTRRPPRQPTSFNMEGLRAILAPPVGSFPPKERPGRKQAMGVSYPSVGYALFRCVCRARWLTRWSWRLIRSVSLSKFFRWNRARDVCPAAEPLQPAESVKAPESPPEVSLRSGDAVEVELGYRRCESQPPPARPRRSRGFAPNAATDWGALPPETAVEESPPVEHSSFPEPEEEPFEPERPFRGWRRYSLGAPDDSDFYNSMLSAMEDIETSAVSEDSKVLELSSLALVSDLYLLQDTLKEEYIPPDYLEELEFLSTLLLFMRIHVVSLTLNLLRFHCLMTSVKETVDWFMLTGLLTSLIQGITAFFYASFDQAVLEELLDDD